MQALRDHIDLRQRASGCRSFQGAREALLRSIPALRGKLGLAEMILNQRDIGQRCRGRFEISERLGCISPQIEDPAVGVLERGHIRPAQPPGHGIGPGKIGRIARRPRRRQQAREIVGHRDRARIPGIKRLVIGPGRSEIARALLEPRPREEQRAVLRGSRDAHLEHLGRSSIVRAL